MINGTLLSRSTRSVTYRCYNSMKNPTDTSAIIIIPMRSEHWNKSVMEIERQKRLKPAQGVLPPAFWRFRRDQRGAVIVEYAMIMAIITVGVFLLFAPRADGKAMGFYNTLQWNDYSYC